MSASKSWLRSNGTRLLYQARFYCRRCFQQVRTEHGLVSGDHPCPGRGTLPDYVGVMF